MQSGEGKELVEYAMIALLALVGVALILSGMGSSLLSLWRNIAMMVFG